MISFSHAKSAYATLISSGVFSLNMVKYGLWNGGLVSPVPGPGRKVTLLVGTALFLAMFAIPALAQEGTATLTEGNFERHISVKSQEEGCPDNIVPCWDISTFTVLPGDKLVIHVDMTSGLHDLTFEPPITAATPKAASGIHDLRVDIPAEVPAGGLTFICSVHPQQMIGHLKTEATLAAAGAHESVPALGVHFLAYWVGVIAFAILFVVYGATFFLFKYNETRATTDHFDRSEGAGGSKRLAAVAPIVAVTIAVVAIAAIIYFAAG